MNITVAEYQKLSQKAVPRSPVLINCIKAYLVGGSICVIGQLITDTARQFHVYERTASLLCTVTLIAISVILTGFGVYDKIAKHAGAGTLVPITGFANAVAAPAIEFKSEGYIMGLAAKMFSIAGPVITYGLTAGVIYGLLYVAADILF